MKEINGSDEDEFEYWLERQLGADPKAQKLYKFHGYLHSDGIDTGTRLGYQRKVRDELNEGGSLF
ncbi:hypothetical protein [Haloterrigena salinisoli]|uniref:hypothetical protein n=1 Tax=Haloterrigena salinisoli TaxID=3132747 RepID=UPI0030CED5AC